MFAKGASSKTKHSLALLGQIKPLRQFYLAGGTAVALRLGHRLSFDLDFFSQKDFSQKGLVKLIEKKGKFKLDQIEKNTLLGFFEDTKVSFFKYDYPLIGKSDYFKGIEIVSQQDLMAMKIDAISSRGIKRDFIDLYFLAQKKSLAKAVSCYREKYKKAKINLFHSLKSLTYFIDAEETQMPRMLKPCNWEKVKRFFLVQTPKIIDQELKKIKK